jgi:hypothetical protein
MTYRRNSNGFTHIFDHARTNGDTADIARRRPSSAIQDGGTAIFELQIYKPYTADEFKTFLVCFDVASFRKSHG